jgi:hypothetical protein
MGGKVMRATFRSASLVVVAAVSSVVGTASASTLYSNDFPGLTPLYKSNQSTGAATVIGPSGFDNVGDLTSDTRGTGSGTIWGVKINTNQLLTFDPNSGAGAVAANLNSPNSMTSIAFDPVGGKLYGNTTIGFGAPFDALYEIDPVTGNCTFIGRITFDNVFALGFDQGGKLYGVSDNTDQLISISTMTGNGTLVAALQLATVFDIASRPEDNVMFLVDSATTNLWTLNVGNGAVTNVGPYGGTNPNLVGLAFSQVPEPAAAGFLAASVVTLAVRRRQPR